MTFQKGLNRNKFQQLECVVAMTTHHALPILNRNFTKSEHHKSEERALNKLCIVLVSLVNNTALVLIYIDIAIYNICIYIRN